MIVCMYRMYRKYDKDKKLHNKVEACVAFALRHILQSCPQARSIFFFHSVREEGKQAIN